LLRHHRALSLLFLACTSAIAQSNTFLDRSFSALDRHGISLSFQLYCDTLVGSRTSETAPRSTAFQFADLSIELDLAAWSPRLSHTQLFSSVHANGSYAADFLGSVQSVAGTASRPGIRVAEIWVEQSLAKSAQLRVGRIDANPDFGIVEIGGNFLNGAAGFDPTFADLPNYTDTRWGLELLLKRKYWRANLAAFAPLDGTGPLLMQEVGTDWQPSNWTGRVSLGFWQRAGRKPSFANINEEGAHGVYAVAEQKFWRHHRGKGRNEQAFSAFLQLGSAPSAFNVFTRHLGAGLIWTAPIASRDKDSAGLAIQRGKFTEHPAARFERSHETVYEAYYHLQLSQQLSVSPDVQYVIHPGGTGLIRNGLAFGARLNLSSESHRE
jgi:carbohydrate-selective porin OprB